MRRVEVPTYTATIYVGGDYADGALICQKFCDEVGLCVTIEALRYVYTEGGEHGLRVGLINYGRFPATPDEIFAKAEALALRLMDGLGMASASIVATDRTVWLSRREEDLTPRASDPQALASGAEQVAPVNASQVPGRAQNNASPTLSNPTAEG